MTDLPPSAREKAQAAQRERRNARRLWRRELLARAAAGESRQALAENQNVSLSTVQRALARAHAERPPESREAFVAMQRERLEKAVKLVEKRIEDGDLAAAYALIQLLPLLESFDDKQRCLALG
jgi:DNA-binding transcriptional MocR family regulator